MQKSIFPMDDIEILDNYFPEHLFKPIEEFFMGSGVNFRVSDGAITSEGCQWAWNEQVNRPDDGYFQFCHSIFEGHVVVSKSFNMIQPILEHENIISLFRIKANLNPRTENIQVYDNGFHTDHGSCNYPHTPKMTTAILYINTNNGYTLFEDGTKVESVRNRLVKFPCSKKHTGTNCSDEKRRVVINFNWF